MKELKKGDLIEYTELIVFKSGVTSLRTKIFDVDGMREDYVFISDKEGNRFFIEEKRVDNGPECALIILHRGKLSSDRVDYCLADVKRVELEAIF